MREPIAITLLTGFLGAGKTTLVNRVLTRAHGRRVGVIVNEFGDLGVDGALVSGATGSVIEVANGCFCCAARGDLLRALSDLLAAGAQLDTVLIESSGLADPGPITDDLERSRLERDARLDGIVAVVDAENFDRNLDSAEAAYWQIASADILIVNKIDLVERQLPDMIEANLRRINPRARIIKTVECTVPLDVLLGPPRVGANAPRDDHSHDGFTSAALRAPTPLAAEAFAAWLEGLPTGIFRVKGFVQLANPSETLLVQCVGDRRSVVRAPSGVHVAGAALVVIGKELRTDDLRRGLEACAS